MNDPRPAPAASADRRRRRWSFPSISRPRQAPGRQVAPGVFWLRMPLPFALDHINLWVLRDGPGWTLVDTGLNTQTTRELWEQSDRRRYSPGLPRAARDRHALSTRITSARGLAHAPLRRPAVDDRSRVSDGTGALRRARRRLRARPPIALFARHGLDASATGSAAAAHTFLCACGERAADQLSPHPGRRGDRHRRAPMAGHQSDTATPPSTPHFIAPRSER